MSITIHDWKQRFGWGPRASVAGMLAGALWLGAGTAYAEEPPGLSSATATAEVRKTPASNVGELANGTTGDMKMSELLMMLGVAGLCGGALNYLQRRDARSTTSESRNTDRRTEEPTELSSKEEAKKPYSIVRALMEGVVAAEVVPLFLSLTDSTLLDGALDNKDTELITIVGLSLIAAVYSESFLTRVSSGVLAAQVRLIGQKAEAAALSGADAKKAAEAAAKKVEEEQKENAQRLKKTEDQMVRALRFASGPENQRSRSASDGGGENDKGTSVLSIFSKRSSTSNSWEWTLEEVSDAVIESRQVTTLTPDEQKKLRAQLDDYTKHGLLLLDEDGDELRWSLTLAGFAELGSESA